MYSSSSMSKRLILALVLRLLTIQLILISSVLSLNMTNAYLNHKCLASQGKYQPGSWDEEIRKSIIKSMHPEKTGYNSGSFTPTGPQSGNNSFVSVVFQCRGDSYGPKCRDCFTTALAGFGRRCPSYKAAIIWYDQCLLATSTIDSLGQIDYENNFCMANSKDQSVDKGTDYKFNFEVTQFIFNLASLVSGVKNISNNPEALYAAGESFYRKTKTKVYGLVQCTQDISPRACEECITFNSMNFQDCLRDKQGGRVVGRSCNFRYEFYPFVTKFH